MLNGVEKNLERKKRFGEFLIFNLSRLFLVLKELLMRFSWFLEDKNKLLSLKKP